MKKSKTEQKKTRGRPRKVPVVATPKKRGRPRKIPGRIGGAEAQKVPVLPTLFGTFEKELLMLGAKILDQAIQEIVPLKYRRCQLKLRESFFAWWTKYNLLGGPPKGSNLVFKDKSI